jgi:hypothetical protein
MAPAVQTQPTQWYSRLLRPHLTWPNNYYLESLQHVEHFEFHANHIFNSQGKKETIDTLLSGQDSKIWTQALSNKRGRLSQGIHGRVVATNTIDFIQQSEVPTNKKVTYGNCICDYRPLKSEPYCVRFTVGGNKLPYEDDAGSPAASLLETKLLLNSTILDANQGAHFLCADLKDHFLASPMKDPEFMRLKYKYFPTDIRQQYNLDYFVASDGYIYI